MQNAQHWTTDEAPMSLSWPPATRLPGHSATVYKLRQSLASFVPPGASDWDPGKPYSGAGGGRDGRKLQERRERRDLSDEVSPLVGMTESFYWQSGGSNRNNVIDQKIFEYRLHVNAPRAAHVYARASMLV